MAPYKNFKSTPVKHCLDDGAPRILRSSTSSLDALRPSRSISRLLDHVVTPSRILRHRFASRRGASKTSTRFEQQDLLTTWTQMVRVGDGKLRCGIGSSPKIGQKSTPDHFSFDRSCPKPLTSLFLQRLDSWRRLGQLPDYFFTPEYPSTSWKSWTRHTFRSTPFIYIQYAPVFNQCLAITTF